MGKYMRKAKTTGEVAVVDVTQSSLGVLTRAKTLALQRLQSADVDDAAPPAENPDFSYLELRSRRLERSHLQLLDARKERRLRCNCKGKELLESKTREERCEAAYFSYSMEGVGRGLEIETSFGENNLGSEAMASKTPECTPCSSSIRVANAASITRSSGTKQTRSTSGNRVVPLNAFMVGVPTAFELEDFFGSEEQSLQQHLREKYNFDFKNESPLEGRYEWVKVPNP